MLPRTEARVVEHSARWKTRRIRAEMELRLERLAGHRAAIDRRLDELDREWDVERVLEANAAALALAGTALGAFHDRRWLALPAVVTGFLLQHAVQGWCPPVPLFRRLGIRTAAEIQAEKAALLAMREDWGVPPRRVMDRLAMH